jgi:RNA polymerase sigma-70 factor (ECF subfamily)
MVLGLCRLLLRDHHEAEDAAQQTFVSAYRALLRGTEPREPGPWLAAIARNECRARIRKRMRAPVPLDGELELELSDSSDDLAELTDRRTELRQLAVEIAKLPSRQREAIALRDFLGLSYEEVATTLKVSVPVVESLLFRARRRLRDTVRTVPRYAAGIVMVPIAMRAAVSREVPDFDAVTVGLGIAGVAGAAAGGVAKLLSVPASVKVAATVAVVATGSVVAPNLIRAPGEENAAPRMAAVQGEDREAGAQSSASVSPGSKLDTPAAPEPPASAPPAAQPAAEPAAEPASESEPASVEPPSSEEPDPDRISSAAEGESPIVVPPPPSSEEAAPCEVDATAQVEPESEATEPAVAESCGEPDGADGQDATLAPGEDDAAEPPVGTEDVNSAPVAPGDGEPAAGDESAQDDTGVPAAPADEPPPPPPSDPPPARADEPPPPPPSDGEQQAGGDLPAS